MLASQVTKGIIKKEISLGIRGLVKPGPADSSIFDSVNGNCIATDMGKKIRIDNKEHKGIKWLRANKAPGTRKAGLEIMREYIADAQPTPEGPRENPGLFVFNTCKDGFVRTVPTIPRSSKDPDDVDTDAEDHVTDEVRYMLSLIHI